MDSTNPLYTNTANPYYYEPIRVKDCSDENSHGI